jgi:signal transduction histidine kinase
MSKLSDKELIEELQQRFSQNKKSLTELSQLTKQLQKVNSQLKESEKIKTQFLSNIRNEINNPLASIMGLSRNIQAASQAHGEKIPSMAALIHAEAFDLDFQLKNIFAAAELESGEWPLEIVQADIPSLVSSMVEMHQHRIQAKQLQVHIIYDKQTDLAHFQTDPAKLQLILSNLLANAIEYSHTKGHLKLSVKKQQKNLSLSIQDFGIGISPADQEIIFNRFTQLNTGVTKSHRGHGLGLSVTKSLLEILNGRITLVSHTNQGSTFTICMEEFESAHDEFSVHGNEFFFNDDERF